MSAFDVRDLLKAAAEPGAAAAERPSAAAREAGPISTVVLAGCVRAGEFALVGLTGLVLHRLLPPGEAPLDMPYIVAILALAGLCVAFQQAVGNYRIGALRGAFRSCLKLALCWGLAFLLVATAMVLAKFAEHFSRLWLGSLFLAGLGALVAGRCVVSRMVAQQMRIGRFDRRTAIVGGGPVAEELIRSLEGDGDTGIRIVGVFDDRGDARATSTIGGYPKLGTVADLVTYAREHRIDLIIFTLPIAAEARILQMLAKLWVLPIDIRISANATKLRLRPRSYSYIGSVPVLDVFDRPIADWDVVAKNLFDRFVAALLLVALAPVMLAVALAVRLTSSGPVLFRQKRHGFNNELIEVFKFRSMYADLCDRGAAKLVTRGDPRVTPVGRFIRKTSLDELPQLFNVVRGDLSLVGPRPHALQAKAQDTLYDQVVDGYFARHRVKPGITGWAQVNGWRGETDTSEKIQRRVEHDLYYIENWSMLFDLKILLATPISLLRTQNAY